MLIFKRGGANVPTDSGALLRTGRVFTTTREQLWSQNDIGSVVTGYFGLIFVQWDEVEMWGPSLFRLMVFTQIKFTGEKHHPISLNQSGRHRQLSHVTH